jgi:hypothetical protein
MKYQPVIFFINLTPMKNKQPYQLRPVALHKPANEHPSSATGLLNADAYPKIAGAAPDDNYLDKQDMLQRMKTSGKTLQRWRKKGLIAFTRMGGKIFYSENALNEMMRKGFLKNRKVGEKKKMTSF